MGRPASASQIGVNFRSFLIGAPLAAGQWPVAISSVLLLERGLSEENVFIKAHVRTRVHACRWPHAPARLDDCPPCESQQLWSL